MYFLAVLKIRSLALVSLGYSQGVSRSGCSLSLWRETLLPCLFQPPVLRLMLPSSIFKAHTYPNGCFYHHTSSSPAVSPSASLLKGPPWLHDWAHLDNASCSPISKSLITSAKCLLPSAIIRHSKGLECDQLRGYASAYCREHICDDHF